MNHPSLEELTLMVHGLVPRVEHVETCGVCREIASQLGDELSVLRTAEARIAPRAASPFRFSRLAPIAASAAIMLAIVAAIVVDVPRLERGPVRSGQETPTRELVRLFLDGTDQASDKARKELLARGPAIIPDLVDVRRKRPQADRIQALRMLIFELQEAKAGDRGKAIFEKLRAIRITLDVQNAPVTAFIDYIREISSLNVVLDPLADADGTFVSVKIRDTVPLADSMSQFLELANLDFDVRSGVFLVAPSDRLWAAPSVPAVAELSENQAKAARGLMARLGSDSPDERERVTSELRKLGAALLPLLEEQARNRDPEVAARSLALIEEMGPRRGSSGSSPLPLSNEWRQVKVQGNPPAVLSKLETMKIDLSFQNTDPVDILAFIRDFSGLKLSVKGQFPRGPATLKVKDLALGDVLELLTLPRGWDVRIVDGGLELFERMK